MSSGMCRHFWLVLYFQSEALDKKFDINLHDIGELGYEVSSNAEYSVIDKIGCDALCQHGMVSIDIRFSLST